MARPKGSKNKRARKKARSAYDTYKGWYEQYTKDGKDRLFSPLLHEKALYKGDDNSFEYWYERAKLKKVANPARYVAMSQEYVARSMEKALKKKFGSYDNMPELDTKEKRKAFAEKYVDDLMEWGMDETDAWRDFENYYY